MEQQNVMGLLTKCVSLFSLKTSNTEKQSWYLTVSFAAWHSWVLEDNFLHYWKKNAIINITPTYLATYNSDWTPKYTVATVTHCYKRNSSPFC